MSDFNLANESFLTKDLSTCAFTTNALAEVLGVPQRTLNDYYARLALSGCDPRKTLDEALAMGLTLSGNVRQNALYVFAEQIVKTAIHFAAKYPKALELLSLTSELGLVHYVASLHGVNPNTSEIETKLDALWQNERNRHRLVWKFFCMSGAGVDCANKLMQAYYGMNCEEFRATYQLNPEAPDTWCPDHTTIETLTELNDLREMFASTSQHKPLENRIQQAVNKTRKRWSK